MRAQTGNPQPICFPLSKPSWWGQRLTLAFSSGGLKESINKNKGKHGQVVENEGNIREKVMKNKNFVGKSAIFFLNGKSH